MTADAKALDLLDDLLTRAKAAGAEAADAVLFDSVSLSYAQRLGELEAGTYVAPSRLRLSELRTLLETDYQLQNRKTPDRLARGWRTPADDETQVTDQFSGPATDANRPS